MGIRGARHHQCQCTASSLSLGRQHNSRVRQLRHRSRGQVRGAGQVDYTAPVGQFPANAFGLHDMHGNVFEWVEDPWHDDYRGSPPPPTDGTVWMEGGDVSRRVVRGGSWNNDPGDLRSAVRNWNTAASRSNNLGF